MRSPLRTDTHLCCTTQLFAVFLIWLHIDCMCMYGLYESCLCHQQPYRQTFPANKLWQTLCNPLPPAQQYTSEKKKVQHTKKYNQWVSLRTGLTCSVGFLLCLYMLPSGYVISDHNISCLRYADDTQLFTLLSSKMKWPMLQIFFWMFQYCFSFFSWCPHGIQ